MKFVCWRCWNVECKKDKQLRRRKASNCKKLRKQFGLQRFVGQFGAGQTLLALQKKMLETKNKTQ